MFQTFYYEFDRFHDMTTELDSIKIADSKVCDPEQTKLNIPNFNNNRSIHIISQNIRSISCNIDNFNTLLSRIGIDYDIIVLTECWLSCAHSIPVLAQYNTHTTTDFYNQSDGVAVYIKTDITNDICEPTFMETNCLLIKLGLHTAILAIYRPHCFKNNTSKFLQSLNTVLLSVASYRNIIIIGDINIDILGSSISIDSQEYLNLIVSHGLLPAHTLPTRGNSSLDHIMLKTKNEAICLIIQSSVTDHDAIMLSLQISPIKINTVRQINKIDHNGLVKYMNEVDFSLVQNSDEPNLASALLVDILAKALIANTKTLRLSCRSRCIKPWITPGLLRCIRNRDNMHKKLRSHPNNETLKLTYYRYRNFCNRLLKNLKRNYDRTEIMNARSNPKKLWKKLKNTLNFNKNQSSADALISQAACQQNQINDINRYFVDIGTALAEKIKSRCCHRARPIPAESTPNSFVLLNTDEDEVEGIIMALKSDCAVGYDQISSNFLKEFKHILTPPITHICKLCLATGVFPEVFKKSLIHPIHKSGPYDCVSNYRPISILPSLSKILERLINLRLVKYLERYNLLSENQYGFRAQRSTADAVHSLTDSIVRGLDGGKKSLAIFLDLAKAFDTVSHPILLEKLESLGIRDISLNLFKSYLENRFQCTKVGKNISEDLRVKIGIPQGSILGPTLFLVFINELCKLPLLNGKIVCFADDTVLLFYGDTWEQTFKDAQIGLNKVINWLNLNQLTVNADKTKYITFTMRKMNHLDPITHSLIIHSCIPPHNHHTCCCPSLSLAHSVKYLGITIDQQLSFQEHITNLTSRTRKLIYVFKSLRYLADFNTIKMVYYALCQSLFIYCITSWGGAAKSHLHKLEIAQRAVLKVATFRPYLFSTNELYNLCEVLSIRKLFILHTILKKHSTIFDPSVSQSKRRNNNICRIQSFKHKFSTRFYCFLSSTLYNKCNKLHEIYDKNKFTCKRTVEKWLLSLDYAETESLIHTQS